MRRLLYGAWMLAMTAVGTAVAVIGARAPAPAPATAVAAPELFDLQKVADGVYAALAKPRTPINCNAAVVVYDAGRAGRGHALAAVERRRAHRRRSAP